MNSTHTYKDYYKILGVTKSADEKEIKQAYRKLARKNHPDVNPGDKSAETRFKEISEAYEVLSNADRRKEYDAFQTQGFTFGGQPGGAGGGSYTYPPGGGGAQFDFDTSGADLGDLFGNLFGGG